MVNPFRDLLKPIYRLIEQKKYFLIHAPRQTGKTTLLHALAHRLNREGQYIGVVCSLESAGYPSIGVENANDAFIQSLYLTAKIFVKEAEMPPNPEGFLHSETSFQQYLSRWAAAQTKPIVLLLDEIDSLYDNVLISVLRQLRNGFQTRPVGFPASIALVGLRDIREYRLKARADNPSIGAGSPFNIKAESFMLTFFSKKEVDSLLQQHTDETGQVFSKKVRDLIYEYSGGQPWLTNALAREIVEKMLDNDFSQKITPKMVEIAKESLIQRRDTHLDSLADKINEGRVRKVVMSVINGNPVNFDGYDDAVRYARDLGLIAPTKPVQFASPIYREIITRILNSSFHDSFNQDLVQTTWYLRPDGSLDMDKLLHAFVEFYRRHSESWLERFQYKEAGHQLLLMAFLQRVVNGGGRIEREMAAGNGRTDLAVFWKNQVIAFELKIRYDAYTESDGLQQISRYLDKLGQKAGYLIIFEKKSSKEIPWDERISWNIRQEGDKAITLITL
jgi:DNA polymerase III delta prime subunit